MAGRGALIALIRRDDTDPTYPVAIVPGSWTVVRESYGWATYYPLGRTQRPDVFFHAWLAVSDGAQARGCFVCVGTPAVLQNLADRIAADALPWTRTWATLAALRADATAAAVSIKTAWRDERPLGDVGNVVRLFRRMAGFLDDDAEG